MIFRATLRRTGSGLLGHVDDAHAPFADLLQQLVGADGLAGMPGDGWRLDGGASRAAAIQGSLLILYRLLLFSTMSPPFGLAATLVTELGSPVTF